MADSTKGDKAGGMRIDPQLVRDLAALLSENELSEIEVADGERRIKVRRGFAPVVAAEHARAAATASAPAPVAADSPPEEPSGTPVKSPMVGTAFLSPEQGTKAFVGVGDKVKAGDTLLIIEAMKVMNPITSPAAGTVRAILVSDAQPVEFDQLMMVIG
ncbi:MAG: acetyl-CoA carboxylase biotin carboxyl carrier protein subunit [Sphingomicrobium sp.]